MLACENIRSSSLFAAGDVSRGGTSATQRQKFHTDDAIQCLQCLLVSKTSNVQFLAFLRHGAKAIRKIIGAGGGAYLAGLLHVFVYTM